MQKQSSPVPVVRSRFGRSLGPQIIPTKGKAVPTKAVGFDPGRFKTQHKG